MADSGNNIKGPTTLKAILEFLSAIRTNMLLRNEICDILMHMINENNHTPDPSRIGSFHDLLDLAVYLRARIIGAKNSEKYGDYENIWGCQNECDVCGESIRACADNIIACTGNTPTDECDITDCLKYIRQCAKEVVEILLKVLPRLYRTMIAFLSRLDEDGKLLFQQCNNENTMLYKWLTNNDSLHQTANCPYYGADEFPRGFTKGDMGSSDEGEQLGAIMYALVGSSGYLRQLIEMMNNSNKESVKPSIDTSIEAMSHDRFIKRCICCDVDDAFNTRKPTKTTVTRRSAQTPRRTRKSRSIRKSAKAASDATSQQSVTPEKVTSAAHVASRVSPATTTVSSSDVGSVLDATQSTTADTDERTNTGVDNGGPMITRIDSDATSTSLPNNGASNNLTDKYKWFFDPKTTHISVAPSQYIMYNVSASPQGNTGGSSCAASAAAGLLAVGCVGVGAAYVFDIGGFGTMVNGMF
ncbi:uncharacterized protein BcabD6B2_56770 [Babesia caballi]|uniref:Uncharacterized protein n=1 Tax=Babesia caballi TaxID=5871 RepID=A0AAV4M197_BABCB|nr:hypothetical protein BcabD6B2_56770 [Babesia caballi]